MRGLGDRAGRGNEEVDARGAEGEGEDGGGDAFFR